VGTKKEDKKERVENGLMEQFYDSLTVEKHLFFLYFERNFTERVARASFFIFFLRFFFDALLALLSLSSFLSFLSSSLFVCFCSRILSTLKTFWRRLKLQSSS
jgi:hypothetical protein